jgi:two-component system sensor histidine kinase KdpD
VAELAEHHKVEAEGEKLRNALLSAVSHDFRTPLASIKGVISSLLMEENRLSPDDKKDLLSSAHGEVARLERIVSNLLEVTLLESGKLKLKKDYYFLPELVGNALKQTEAALQGRAVTCQMPPDPPALQVDGLLIEQVLVNLLENAAKYTPAGSPVAIHANSYGGRVNIVIEDEGSGIPAGEEEKIFDAFHTVAPSMRKGSGLGLAICRGILQAHGGVIRAENRPQGGAVFTITLPVSVVPTMTEAA